MGNDNERGSLAEAAGIVVRFGRMVRGRLREFATEKSAEARQSLREVREELDAEIRSTEPDDAKTETPPKD